MRVLRSGFFFLCFLVMSCSSSTVEVSAPVAGIIKVDGKPIDIGWITFHPDESRGNGGSHLSVAEIGKDGSFAFATNGKPGVPPGHYKVVIAATHDEIPLRPKFGEDGRPWQPNWLTHQKYTNAQTTDLQIEVIENPEPGRYDFHLAR